jgi:hypothetical protein
VLECIAELVQFGAGHPKLSALFPPGADGALDLLQDFFRVRQSILK